MKQHGSVENFQRQHPHFQKQYEDLIDGIVYFFANHAAKSTPPIREAQIQDIKAHLDEFKKHLFFDNFHGAHTARMFSEVKHQLHALDELLKNNEIPLPKRLLAIQAIAQKMTACVGAVVPAVTDTVSSLSSMANGCKGATHRVWLQMVEQVILEHVKLEHAHAYGGMFEVHYVHAYTNAMADSLGGIPRKKDPFTHSDTRGITPERIKACKQKIIQKIPPYAVAKVLAEECHSVIAVAAASQGVRYGNEVTGAKIKAVNDAIDSVKEAELNGTHGEIPTHAVLHAVDESYEKFALTTSTEPLEKHFLQQLKEKKLIDLDDAMVLGTTANAGQLNSLGELLWVNTNGVCEPAQASDLYNIAPAQMLKNLQSNGVGADDLAGTLRAMAQCLMAEPASKVPPQWFAQFFTACIRHVPTEPGQMPIAVELAASRGQAAHIERLLKEGVDTNTTYANGQNAMILKTAVTR
jgi:hypothetical protein